MARKIVKYLSAALLILLFLLAGLAGGSSHSVDLAIMRDMAEARAGAPLLVQVAEWWTMLGGAAFTIPLAALMAAFLLIRRQSSRALILVAMVLGERALVHALKEWVGRPRPLDGEYSIGSMAFPSGHAANSMTVYLAIAILAAPAVHRRPLVIGAILLSFTIGLTRVFLGVHWLSDIIGGWALGLATVLLAIAVARRSAVLPLATKHEVVGWHGDAARENEAS